MFSFTNILLLMVLVIEMKCEASRNSEIKREGIGTFFDLEFRAVSPKVDFVLTSPNDITIVKDFPMVFVFNVQRNMTKLHLINLESDSGPWHAGNFLHDSPTVHTGAVKQKDYSIIAIANRGNIDVFTISNREKLQENVKASMEPLQRISLNDKIESIHLVHHKVSREAILFMIVLTKSAQKGDTLVLFRWMSSGFHKTQEKHLRRIHEVFTLKIEPCQNPLIFVSVPNNDKNAVHVYTVDHNDRLQTQQKLYLDFKVLEPFTLSCESYNFFTCRQNQKNVCSIYQSKTDHIEFIEQGKLYLNLKKRKIAYDKGLMVIWNVGKANTIAAFTNSNMRSYKQIFVNQESAGELLQMSLSRKNQSTYSLLLVYKNLQAVSVQRAELYFVRNQQINAGHPLEDVVKRIHSIIHSRKLLYDTVAAVTTDKSRAIQTLNLDKFTIVNGTVSKLLLNDSSFLKPYLIQSRLEVFKEHLAANSQKTIYIKNLKVRTLIYQKPIYYGFPKNDSRQLVFCSNTVVKSNRIYSKEVAAFQEGNIAQSQKDISKLLKHIKLSQNTAIESITVDFINKMNFSQLYGDSFLKNRDSLMNGSLETNMQQSGSVTQIADLTAIILNQRRINDFFTLRTNQKIESDLFVSKFLVQNISVGQLNSVDVKSIALTGVNNTLASLIRIEDFQVAGDLLLSFENEAHFTNQVRLASKLEKFSQFYQGHVSLKGQLFLNNFYTTNVTEVILGLAKKQQSSIIGSLSQHFWMKNIPQTLSQSMRFSNTVNFHTLYFPKMNNILSNEFLMRSNNSKITNFFPALNVRIAGNLENYVFTENKKNSIRVDQLRTNLVYKNVDVHEIYGRKEFQRTLNVWDLKTGKFGSVYATQLVWKPISPHSIHFLKAGGIHRLNVKHFFLIDTSILTAKLNMRNLSMYFNLATMIDQKAYSYRKLRFGQNIVATDMKINFVNQLHLPKSYTSTYQNLNFDRSLVIHSNVIFKEDLQVRMLNQVIWREYFDGLVLSEIDTRNVGGNKRFTKIVQVNLPISVEELNNFGIDRLFKATLRKTDIQTIFAGWKLENILMKELATNSTIGSIDASLLISSNRDVKIIGRLKIATIKLRGGFFGLRENSSTAHELLKRLHQVEESYWMTIDIRRNASWPNSSDELGLHYNSLQNFAVRHNSRQKIMGKVHFKGPPRFLSSSNEYDFAGIDIMSIAQDSFLRTANLFDVSFLTGMKYFEKPMKIVGSTYSRHLLNAEKVNGFDVLSLNQSFYRKNVIKHQRLNVQKKILPNALIGNLTVKGLVNSVDIRSIVFVGLSTKTPFVSFTESSLIVKQLDIVNINTINFPAFLEGRLRVTGGKQIINGSLTFDTLRLNKTLFSRINGYTLDRFAFKELNRHQIIHGYKIFANPLLLIGPSSIINMNGVEFIQKFERSVRLSQNLTYKKVGISERGKASFHDGLNIQSKLDYFSNKIETIEQLRNKLYQMKAQSLYAAPQKHKSRFLYLEQNIFLKFNHNIYNKNAHDLIEFSEVCSSSTPDSKEIIFPSIKLEKALSQAPNFSIHPEHMKVIAKNNCSTQGSELEIKLNKTQYTFMFAKSIESVEMFEANDPLVLFAIVNFSTKQSVKSINIYRINLQNNTTTYVQEINRSVDSETAVKFMKNEASTSIGWILLLSANKINVFAFNPEFGQFEEISVHILQYDQIALFSTKTEAPYQLITANSRDRFVSVFMANQQNKFQTIYLPNSLKTIATLQNLESEEMILIIQTHDGRFYSYKYLSNVEGWTYESTGMITEQYNAGINRDVFVFSNKSFVYV